MKETPSTTKEVVRHPVSGVVLCYNEARTIKACIESLMFYCNEVFVLDGGSTDGTKEILRSLAEPKFSAAYNCVMTSPMRWEVIDQGGGTFDETAENYGYHQSQRLDYCLKTVAHDWVLILDADEVLPLLLNQSSYILNTDYFQKQTQAIQFRRVHLFDSKTAILSVDGVPWWPDLQTRFFNRKEWHYDLTRKRHAVPIQDAGLPPILTEDLIIWHLHGLVEDTWWTNPPKELKTFPLLGPCPWVPVP